MSKATLFVLSTTLVLITVFLPAGFAQQTAFPGADLYGDLDWQFIGAAISTQGCDQDKQAPVEVTFSALAQEDRIAPLIEKLKSKDTSTRQAAARSLGETGDIRATRPLLDAANDKYPEVRREAAEAMKKLGLPAARTLIDFLNDKDSELRQKAAYLLGMMQNAEALDPLIVALSDKSPLVRRRAAMALGLINNNKAVQPLIAALKDEDDEVRSTAAGSLGRLKDSRAVEPLAAMLSITPSVERSKVRIVGIVGEGDTVAAFIDESNTGNYKRVLDVGATAAVALGKIGEVSLKSLTAGLTATNGWMRGSAIMGLSYMKSERAVGYLIGALRDELDINRRLAQGGLEEMTKEKVGSDPERWREWWEKKKTRKPRE